MQSIVFAATMCVHHCTVCDALPYSNSNRRISLFLFAAVLLTCRMFVAFERARGEECYGARCDECVVFVRTRLGAMQLVPPAV